MGSQSFSPRFVAPKLVNRIRRTKPRVLGKAGGETLRNSQSWLICDQVGDHSDRPSCVRRKVLVRRILAECGSRGPRARCSLRSWASGLRAWPMIRSRRRPGQRRWPLKAIVSSWRGSLQRQRPSSRRRWALRAIPRRCSSWPFATNGWTEIRRPSPSFTHIRGFRSPSVFARPISTSRRSNLNNLAPPSRSGHVGLSCPRGARAEIASGTAERHRHRFAGAPA